jgi:hypothetical protein
VTQEVVEISDESLLFAILYHKLLAELRNAWAFQNGMYLIADQ